MDTNFQESILWPLTLPHCYPWICSVGRAARRGWASRQAPAGSVQSQPSVSWSAGSFVCFWLQGRHTPHTGKYVLSVQSAAAERSSLQLHSRKRPFLVQSAASASCSRKGWSGPSGSTAGRLKGASVAPQPPGSQAKPDQGEGSVGLSRQKPLCRSSLFPGTSSRGRCVAPGPWSVTKNCHEHHRAPREPHSIHPSQTSPHLTSGSQVLCPKVMTKVWSLPTTQGLCQLG